VTKKGVKMFKSFACGLLLVLFVSVVMLSGCNTAKGVGDGVGCTAKGVTKDAQATKSGIMALDAWIKKNAW